MVGAESCSPWSRSPDDREQLHNGRTQNEDRLYGAAFFLAEPLDGYRGPVGDVLLRSSRLRHLERRRLPANTSNDARSTQGLRLGAPPVKPPSIETPSSAREKK